MADNADDLGKLFPNRRIETVGGLTLELAPVPIAKLPALARLAADGMSLPGDAPILAWLAQEPLEPWIKAVAIMAGMDEEWVGALPGDEFVALLLSVVEVNRRFFVETVAPAVTALTAMLVPANGEDGPTPSPSSAPMATG